MPTTDSQLTLMEDPHKVEDEEGSRANIPSSGPPTVPSSAPPLPATTRPNFSSETVIEPKAVSMASTGCSSALSSPAEASPAKPAVASPTTFEGTVEMNPATSHIASASDSLTSTGTSLVNISESPVLSPVFPTSPSSTFGSPNLQNDFPAVLTFKGVSVTLENNSVWRQFHNCGTEMILTKQGRRMFPYCRYRLAGLDPERQYSLVLSILPSDQYRYRWNTSKWEITGVAEHQAQGLIRAFSHHYSPCRGSEWMNGLVSFYKLKLTNNSQDQEGHIILHSMHRYIPRLHVIPVPDGDLPTHDKPVVMGPESMTFTFPQTEFMAVTTYQNFRITQLKINYNPFAKGFREDGNNSRLSNRNAVTEAQLVVKTDTKPDVLKPAELCEAKEEDVVDLSKKNHIVSVTFSNMHETKLILKPIMSSPARNGDPYVPCLRGKHALGELVLVHNPPLVEPKEEAHAVSITPKRKPGVKVTPTAVSISPTSSPSTPQTSPGNCKRRKKINRHWGNSRGRAWKAVTASPTVIQSPSMTTVAMQPELDDVEGLLFVSFTSKEALEDHVRDKPANNSSSASPVSLKTPVQLKQTLEVIPETDQKTIGHSEANLLQDLKVLKHRQVIHPVLQEVGLKLSSLDPTKSIDLQYLGVQLPLPPPDQRDRSSATTPSPGDEGLHFLSRTGKTSDITKIKGWRNKFIKRKETSPSCEGSQKNLSAFCSNMLDEYLESEAQYITERAAAFSTAPEGSVSYQLPAKSSSYVKTLDSALRHRKAASKLPARTNKPCPLSHKPLLYSALTSPVLPLPRPATPVQAGSQPVQWSSSHVQPVNALTASAASGSSSGSSSTTCESQRLSTNHPGVSQKPAVSFGQSQGTTHRTSSLTKLQLKLLQMEIEAMNQGLSRTQLTPDRLSVALSVMLTKSMMPNQLRVARHPKDVSDRPVCGQMFCRLGCVCSSLQQQKRRSFHCGRPECMLGCECIKRNITTQLMATGSEGREQPFFSMSYMDADQPHLGSQSNKLWKRNIHDEDPDPLAVPQSAPLCSTPLKSLKRSSAPHPAQPVREEDKGPVYKYLESMMTCARVREFNCKPPPEISVDPKILDIFTPEPQKTNSKTAPKTNHKTPAVRQEAENASQGTTSNETEVRKQIEIQSGCKWDADQKMVLEALLQRMNQDRLTPCFYIGPYRIHLVTKILIRKPGGSILTYRVHISRPSQGSGNDDELDDSDKDKCDSEGLDSDSDAEEEVGQAEERQMPRVTPFFSGVLPAGLLRARTKPVGSQGYGLIQANGKSYNQARLLLGNMGSLHPANRLAAYVTGRLRAPADISHKNSPKSDATNKINTPGTLSTKASGSGVSPIIPSLKTTDLKTSAQPPVQQSHPDSCGNLSQCSQNSSTNSSIQTFVRSRHGSTSSPVSLTVSPSLKTPSFLGQSGTYSFRICPPANHGSKGKNLPGVTLPGGFTLIELPKPGGGADGAVQQSGPEKTTNMAAMDKEDALFNFGHLAVGSDGVGGAKDLSGSRSVEPGSSLELVCDEKMLSDESDEANIRQGESNMDVASEDVTSDSSDDCGEGEDELVDIDTVEKGQEMAIAEILKQEAVRRSLQGSRDSSDDFGSAREPSLLDPIADEDDEFKDNKKRKHHTALERQRRSEQRNLFDKLQTVLQSDPRAPRLRLLSLALKEIHNLVETSKCLEEKKKRLVEMQSVYLKQLSFLSGKSDSLIKQKLKQICERQKQREKTMKWNPFFSNLLQSRAAHLRAGVSPLLLPDIHTAPFHSGSHPTEAQNSLHRTPAPPSLPRTVTSPVQADIAAPSPQAENQPGESAASVQSGEDQPNFEGQSQEPGLEAQTACQPEVPTVRAPLQETGAQHEASPVSSIPSSSNTTVFSSTPFALPLIRSKTGRLILPSSLKPIGQGFYTLTVMKAKEEQGAAADVQLSDVDSSLKQNKSLSDSERLSDLEEDKTEQPSKPKKRRSVKSDSPVEMALVSKSKFMPAVALQVSEKSQERSSAVGGNKAQEAAYLSFNRVHQIPTGVGPEPDVSPPVVVPPKSRPRKRSSTPVSENKKDKTKSISESETSCLAAESQSENVTLKAAGTAAGDASGMVSDSPAPAKRRRGRPPRKKRPQPWRTSVTQAGSSSSKSNEDSPVRLPRHFKSSDTKPKDNPATKTPLGNINTARPLTRGALGKDFPSAKKRYWIDLEKELDPELDSE